MGHPVGRRPGSGETAADRVPMDVESVVTDAGAIIRHVRLALLVTHLVE